jgi:hypothetical protein
MKATPDDLSMATYDELLRLARAPNRSLNMTELAERVMMSPSGLTRRGIREHFTGRLTEKPLRDVASALEAVTGPHEPH